MYWGTYSKAGKGGEEPWKAFWRRFSLAKAVSEKPCSDAPKDRSLYFSKEKAFSSYKSFMIVTTLYTQRPLGYQRQCEVSLKNHFSFINSK